MTLLITVTQASQGVSLLVERALKRTLSGSGAVLMPYLGTSRSLNKTDESAIPTAEQFYLRMETVCRSK